MKFKLFELCASLGLLIIVIHGHRLKDEMDEMAKKNEKVNGIFVPGNIIDLDAYRMTFKGTRTADNLSVAMRFIQMKDIALAELEFEMYHCLDAIHTDVERYGIPNIYYADKYNDTYFLLVISHYECTLNDKLNHFTIESLDSLILFRDYVRQSKYLHSRGIFYGKITQKKMVLRKSRSFLIDFEDSTKMDGNIKINAISRMALDDWESFLCMMCKLSGIYLEKFKMNSELSKEKLAEKIIEHIKANIACEHLKEIFLKFAEQTFKKDRLLPEYDELDKLIMAKIEILKNEEGPAVFTWLSGDEREEAIEDLETNPAAKACEIKFPKEPIKHVDADFRYFVDHKDAVAEGTLRRKPNGLNRLNAFLANRFDEVKK